MCPHFSRVVPKPSKASGAGFVLPVVLVMLVVMTTVVLFMMRRGTIDERLASNVRGIVAIDASATYVLRYCELWVTVHPPGVAAPAGASADFPPPPTFMPAPAQGATAAWLVPANWTATANTLAPAVLGPDAKEAQCLIEDASAELEVMTDSPTGDSNAVVVPPLWQKYRITAQVVGDGPYGDRISRAQSELRLKIN